MTRLYHHDLDREVWRHIPGWPKYKVSNFGRCSKHKVYRQKTGKYKGQINNGYYYKLLRPWDNSTGRVIGLWGDGNRKTMRVMHAIALAFFFTEGTNLEFIDGNIYNVRMDNLRVKGKTGRLATREVREHIWHEVDNRPEGSTKASVHKHLANAYLVSRHSIEKLDKKDWRQIYAIQHSRDLET